MSSKRWIWLALLILAPLALVLAQPGVGSAPAVVRAKGRPLSALSQTANTAAAAVARADPRVAAALTGRTVFIHDWPAGDRVGPAQAACRASDCHEVVFFAFDTNTLVQAIVDLPNQKVVEFSAQPGAHPEFTPELSRHADEMARRDPQVLALAAGRPFESNMEPGVAWFQDSSCAAKLAHWCAGLTYMVHGTIDILVAFVDLNEDRVVGAIWSPSDAPETQPAQQPEELAACPASGTYSQDGWTVNYRTTSTDGLEVYDVTFNGQSVFTQAKLPQVNVAYSNGRWGYEDSVGCRGIVPPKGQTLIQQTTDGFAVYQDFRMFGWPNSCNYRYDQTFYFNRDGTWRPRAAAYGPGCSNDGVYRPFIRIDISINGQDGDSFRYFQTGQWRAPATEGDYPQVGDLAPDLTKWRLGDETPQIGYAAEPRMGTNLEPGPPDNAHFVVLAHHSEEGDNDLPTQGRTPTDIFPLQWANGESIQTGDIVYWYVSQSQTTQNPPYCWSPGGDEHPCITGALMHPLP